MPTSPSKPFANTSEGSTTTIRTINPSEKTTASTTPFNDATYLISISSLPQDRTTRLRLSISSIVPPFLSAPQSMSFVASVYSLLQLSFPLPNIIRLHLLFPVIPNMLPRSITPFLSCSQILGSSAPLANGGGRVPFIPAGLKQ